MYEFQAIHKNHQLIRNYSLLFEIEPQCRKSSLSMLWLLQFVENYGFNHGFHFDDWQVQWLNAYYCFYLFLFITKWFTYTILHAPAFSEWKQRKNWCPDNTQSCLHYFFPRGTYDRNWMWIKHLFVFEWHMSTRAVPFISHQSRSSFVFIFRIDSIATASNWFCRRLNYVVWCAFNH